MSIASERWGISIKLGAGSGFVRGNVPASRGPCAVLHSPTRGRCGRRLALAADRSSKVTLRTREDLGVLTEFYEKQKTDLEFVDERMRRIVDVVRDRKPARVLDIACGRGFLLQTLRTALPDTSLVGADISESSVRAAREKGFEAVQADVEASLPFEPSTFDCVIFGEVIEHLIDPDAALVNVATVLRKDGYLVLTTPNLASWFNRIILLAGLQPIFTETSLHANLGRGSRFLGQWRSTQGHLKIFTLRALREILAANGFRVLEVTGVPFPSPNPLSPIDRFLARVPTLASNFVVTASNLGARQTHYPK